MNETVLITAAMIADGAGKRVAKAPGAILLDGETIIASGSPQSIGQPSDCHTFHLPHAIVLPALVNAHAHLDLTHIGPVPFTGDFSTWAESVARRRATSNESIHQSVLQGVERSRAGGTALIGDIAGAGPNNTCQALRTLRECGLPGVCYVEFFGLGVRQATAGQLMQKIVNECPAWENGVALGLQPHAPYSCGMDVYRAATRFNLPLATHLAETLEELEFVRTATGPLRDLIHRLGVWDDSIAGHGCHPVDCLAERFAATPFVAAHLNYIDDAHIEMLSRWPITVAYCPRASAYFGHPHNGWPQHRYREMLKAGINVALGTDSIICLDRSDRLSVLDDMRFLYRRDNIDSATLLRMATINGAIGLGFQPDLFTLAPGLTAGLLAIEIDPQSSVDPQRQMLMNDNAPVWVHGPLIPKDSWQTATTMSTVSRT